MEKRIILRGFGVGALGGLLAFIFARIMSEPLIQKAIDYESGRDAAQNALRKAAGLARRPRGHGGLQPRDPAHRRHRHRDGPVRPCDGRLLRGRVHLVQRRTQVRCGRGRLRSWSRARASSPVPRAVPEVPGQPAGDRPRGHDRDSARSCTRDGRRSWSRSDGAAVLPAGLAAEVRHLECDAARRTRRSSSSSASQWPCCRRSATCTTTRSTSATRSTETPQPLRTPGGTSSTRASRPTCCSGSGCTR